MGDLGSIPGLGKSPGGGHGNPLQYSFLENLHGQRSLEACSPWGHKESDATERLNWTDDNCTFNFSRNCYSKWLYHFTQNFSSSTSSPTFGTAHAFYWASLVAQSVRNRPACGRPGFDSWVGKIPWRKAWKPTPVFFPRKSPWTEEPGGLQSMGSQRVGHNWATKHSTAHVFYNYSRDLKLHIILAIYDKW